MNEEAWKKEIVMILLQAIRANALGTLTLRLKEDHAVEQFAIAVYGKDKDGKEGYLPIALLLTPDESRKWEVKPIKEEKLFTPKIVSIDGKPLA